MPASIYITGQQLRRLAEFDCDVVVHERVGIADSLEAWPQDKNYGLGVAHSLIIDHDGEVTEDTIKDLTQGPEYGNQS